MKKLKKCKINVKLLSLLIDLVMVTACVFCAYWFVNWEKSALGFVPALWGFLAFNVILFPIWYKMFGLYAISLRSISVIDGLRIFFSSIVIGCFNILYIVFIGKDGGLSYGVALLYTVLLFLGSTAWRFSKRIYNVLQHTYKQPTSKHKKRVMIVGGGEAGLALMKEMMYSDKSNYVPVCIIDDDPMLYKKVIYNVEVAGTTNEVEEVAKRFKVEEILVTMPRVDNKRRSEIIKICQASGLPVKVLPSMFQLADGQVTVSKLREVDIQDLLGRAQVQVDLEEVMRYIKGKTVLVTGGGGSIGSELCRQIANQKPNLLIILDIYENNAYDIEQELKRNHSELNLLTLIASIRDKKKINDVFEKYRPQIVFNAAAHKHVPLMETSPNEAVKNNVFGTLNVARAADAYGVETFVQISTDKAVNPTNIMGATKRICEMIIQTIGKHSKNTKFVAVRFGNVLGSNGSVIPLFKRQIQEGGPVTVTHKDIIRYFMTIPEAVSLVLEAGAHAQGGQIFVLDMGEPVRIYDLACNLIKLSGYEPNVDIEIKCTGLRPGEKLFEERLMEEEGLQSTENGLISIAKPIPLDEDNLWTTLDELYEAAHAETEDMKQLVQKLVSTYKIDAKDSSAVAFMRSAIEKTVETQIKEDNA